ncbi:hypothetical protein AMELA_G00189270 [Ameiurus melas]|uniref:Uncharacterized protein n=1 Tax=Ameiurus melas TaxID=219545 RepID=A0A7J6A8B1_AMEME|nr:hypothetical protein AMELA_G00189270 [Ameiurus melas]
MIKAQQSRDLCPNTWLYGALPPAFLQHPRMEISSEAALLDLSREIPNSQQAYSEISSYLSVCEIGWCHPKDRLLV